MEKNKRQGHSNRNNKATGKNINSYKFMRKNKDIPTSYLPGNIQSDVLGSYTGVPEDADNRPVQDVDDL